MPDTKALEVWGDELDKATARGSKVMPGVVAAAVDKTGKIIYSKTSGFTSVLPRAQPIALDSTFVVASCTKIISSVATLQCVERGLISLDEPVEKYLPELAELPLLTTDKPFAPAGPGGRGETLSVDDISFKLRSVKNKITLRQLLTHTFGVSYDVLDLRLQAWRQSRGEVPIALNGNIVEGFAVPLVHEPGSNWCYGGGCDWAGLLVGRLNKTTFGQFLEDNMFRPLGMKSSTFHLEKAEHVQEKLVTMSVRGGLEAGELVAGDNGLLDPVKEEMGGGGLYSTVPDFLKVLGDLISDKPVLLKPETIDLLFTPKLEVGGDAFETMNAQGWKLWGHWIPDSGVKLNHGMGSALTTEEVKASGVPKGTITWAGYAGPIWEANRERGVAWFYATQVLPFGDVESGRRAEAFGKAVFAD
ncbi:beta-lactamase/transpeptidase-like protein [Mollisia scopiformis]|uniref:Beta-lactamase/transpeptidase-like protein n=1 Tax=Mollisia scopiformis TaxID=149040 RepID=A0A194X4F6_MOLSC|nr:beta-lactamase/transpeptidase-like protein [Mollisia scopiformis]KUJ15068.1 beta-lactamase/transpeptidase-like protein [Mollisia scopiformis]